LNGRRLFVENLIGQIIENVNLTTAKSLYEMGGVLLAINCGLATREARAGGIISLVL
jgi:hypothetical protein